MRWNIPPNALRVVILGVLFYLLFVPLSFLPAYNELKLPVASCLLFLFLFFHPFQMVKADRWIGLFVLFMVISLTDIQHLAWAWQSLFTWILVFVLVISGRPFFRQHERELVWLLQAAFWVTVLYLLICGYVYRETSKNVMMYVVWPWKIFGKNVNFAPLVPLLLLPNVLFVRYSGWWGWLLRIAAIAAVLHLVIYFDSTISWVILTAFLVISGSMLVVRKHQFNYWAGVVIVLICLYWWGGEAIGTLIISRLEQSETSRLPFDKLAFALSAENPINGLGMGSWFFTAGQHVVESESWQLLKPQESQLSFHDFFAYNHNYFTRLLTEVGFLGVLAWVGIPLVLFTDLVFSKRELRLRNLKFFLMLSGFYVSCLTMRQSVSDYVDLSEMQFIGFLGYGLYTRDMQTLKWHPPGWLTYTLASILLIWFSFNFLADHYQLKAIAFAREGKYREAVSNLEPYYHPLFKTSIKDVEPIARHIARWYHQLDELEKAKYWYQEGLKCAPFDPGLRYEYKLFLEKPDDLRAYLSVSE